MIQEHMIQKHKMVEKHNYGPGLRLWAYGAGLTYGLQWTINQSQKSLKRAISKIYDAGTAMYHF